MGNGPSAAADPNITPNPLAGVSYVPQEISKNAKVIGFHGLKESGKSTALCWLAGTDPPRPGRVHSFLKEIYWFGDTKRCEFVLYEYGTEANAEAVKTGRDSVWDALVFVVDTTADLDHQIKRLAFLFGPSTKMPSLVLVLANKLDSILTRVTVSHIENALRVMMRTDVFVRARTPTVQCRVLPSVALTGNGLRQGMGWLAERLGVGAGVDRWVTHQLIQSDLCEPFRSVAVLSEIVLGYLSWSDRESGRWERLTADEIHARSQREAEANAAERDKRSIGAYFRASADAGRRFTDSQFIAAFETNVASLVPGGPKLLASDDETFDDETNTTSGAVITAATAGSDVASGDAKSPVSGSAAGSGAPKPVIGVHHLDFVRLIYSYLRSFGRRAGVKLVFAKAEQLPKVTNGIFQFHFTKTYFWIQIVDFCVAVSGAADTATTNSEPAAAAGSDAKSGATGDATTAVAAAGPSFEEFIRLNSSLANPDLVYEYYTRAVCDTPNAAKEFVLPDRKKLPQFIPSAQQTAAAGSATAMASASGSHTKK